MESSLAPGIKANKVRSAHSEKKMQVAEDHDGDMLKEGFDIKRAKSISVTRSVNLGDDDEHKLEKEEEVFELPEDSFLPKKEAPKQRKNSVGMLLNKKITVDATSEAPKENIPKNIAEEGEKEENEEGKEGKKKERRKKKHREKKNDNKKENVQEEEEEGEGEEEEGEIKQVEEPEKRKSSIDEILTRRSSIGIVSPRNTLIQAKSYQKNRQLESDEGKTDLSRPQSVSSGNKVLYQQVGSQLHYHTATGSWEIVEDLLNSHPDSIEHRSEDGRTVLHIAASLGHLHIVKGLLERNIDINTTMNNGLTPLMLCTAQGKADVVQLLLDFGASYCAQTVKDGYSALHLAAMHRQVRTAQVLLSYIKEQTLIYKPKGRKDAKSIMSGTLPLLEYLELRSNKGYSAFHLATVEGDLAILQLLVEFGADFKATTTKKWTPLHFAAHTGNQDICSFLLNLDPSMVDIKNEAKEKPFDIAVFQKHDYLLEQLTPKIPSKPKKPKKTERKEGEEEEERQEQQ